ncbi:MAG: dethiobiotin synthase [Actinomycetota bacterium]|nr:dethiobiotin synthase [Actinomycetota bacterium]
MRPDRLIAVLGTGTGVGKTWVAADVLGALRAAGLSVAARKPVQSFAPCDVETDADVLALATGDAPYDICREHRWYPMAMAPPIAAAFLGMPPPTLDELLAELVWPDGTDVGLVETVGGPRSPLAVDGDSAGLAAALAPHLSVLVSPAGLGAINAVRLCAPTLPQPFVVFLNRFDRTDVHDGNLRWLQGDGFEVVVDPKQLAARVAGR